MLSCPAVRQHQHQRDPDLPDQRRRPRPDTVLLSVGGQRVSSRVVAYQLQILENTDTREWREWDLTGKFCRENSDSGVSSTVYLRYAALYSGAFFERTWSFSEIAMLTFGLGRV